MVQPWIYNDSASATTAAGSFVLWDQIQVVLHAEGSVPHMWVMHQHCSLQLKRTKNCEVPIRVDNRNTCSIADTVYANNARRYIKTCIRIRKQPKWAMT
jgi:hypothetical protein